MTQTTVLFVMAGLQVFVNSIVIIAIGRLYDDFANLRYTLGLDHDLHI